MREVGVIVWALFIVIGVIANIASTARKQAASRTPQPPQAKPLTVSQAAVTAAPVGVRSAPPVRRPQSPPAVVASPPPPARELAARRPRPFFADAPALVRGIIAAEVLGKPRALRDE